MKPLFTFDKCTLSYERVKAMSYTKLISLGIIILSLLFFLGWLSGTNKYVVQHYITKHTTDTLLVVSIPFTPDALRDLLMDCHIRYPHIVYAQAKIESGNWKSSAFNENHNMFGMKKAHRRITSSRIGKGNYAYYRDWLDCVYDYAMYQSTVMCDVQSEEQYFAKLASTYAEDTNYVAVIKQTIISESLRTKFEN